jgi:hypothetical protein
MGQSCSFEGGEKKHLHSFGGETSCKVFTWETKKEIGRHYQDRFQKIG